MAKFEKGKTPPGAKPFQPGQSGNPGGRPRKLPGLDTVLDKVLGEERDLSGFGRLTVMEAVVRSLVTKAISKGDVRAAEILLNRAYGLPSQKVETQALDENGNPIAPPMPVIVVNGQPLNTPVTSEEDIIDPRKVKKS